MEKSHVELDFFGLHNLANSLAHKPQPLPQTRHDRRQSFLGISKINPEIVKSVIASSKPVATESDSKSLFDLPASPRLQVSQLPVFQPYPCSRSGSLEKARENARMIIFYGGSVSAFDLPKDKAEYIMKLVMEKNISINSDGQIVDHSSFNPETTHNNILGHLNHDGDMPIKRKKSLQRFFEKRKQRLISVSPCTSMDHNSGVK